MNRILVIRFSSMGDVLLTAPVIKGALEANPDLRIDFVTKKHFAGYFQGIERLNVIPADTDLEYKGFLGLMRLSREILKAAKPDLVIDLHEVIRSRVLRYFFALRGIPVYRINKGRREKKAYIKGKKQTRLKHTTERYSDVFSLAGIDAPLVNFPFSSLAKPKPKKKLRAINIGLAPFARHQAKAWSLANMVELISLLSSKMDVAFYFYGSKNDADRLSSFDFGQSIVTVHAGKLSPNEELKSISELDLFVSMDSANMHLADLVGIPVISVWGATHPDLGFRPLNQPDIYAVQAPEAISCRPCSVYGNKACTLKDSKYKCLLSISPDILASKILSVIQD